ncbi:MAG: type II toxin-antitoxin system RelE/ParE family toxin [Nitrospirota bacterium]
MICDDVSDGDFERIHKASKRLENNPLPDGKHIKKLKGYKNLYRLRIGDYRVVFEWKGESVTIIRVLTKQDFGKKY